MAFIAFPSRHGRQQHRDQEGLSCSGRAGGEGAAVKSISLGNCLSCALGIASPSPARCPGPAGLADARGASAGAQGRARTGTWCPCLADAPSADKVLVLYCLVFWFFIAWFSLCLGSPWAPGGSPPCSTSPWLCPWFWGWQVLPGPAVWGSSCVVPPPALQWNVIVLFFWKKRNYCLELIFIYFS